MFCWCPGLCPIMTGMEWVLVVSWLGSLAKAVSMLGLSKSSVAWDRELPGSGVTANGRKLSRSDQLCSEVEERLEVRESSRPRIKVVELWLVSRLAGGNCSWVGVE